MRRAKLFISIAAVALLVIAMLFFSAGRIITAGVRQRLEKIFPESTVSIGKCRIKAGSSLVFSNITVKKPGSYDFRIREAGIYYAIPSVFSGTIKEIRADNVSIGMAGMNAEVSFSDVRASARIKGGALSIDSLKARLLGGDLGGNLKVPLGRNAAFSAALNIDGLRIADFVRNFKLDNKFQMDGKLGGDFLLSGRGFDITAIEGGFVTDSPGGTLVIKDKSILQNIARRSGQSLDILVESFEHYDYTIGRMKVSLDGRDLLLDIALEGAAGRRSLNIVLHEFIPE